MSNKIVVKRGEVYYADLSPSFGCEQGGLRPVVIIQNNVGNKYAPTTIVAPITSSTVKHQIPTHYVIPAGEGGLSDPDSMVLCEQIRTIDKSRLKGKLGTLTADTMREIDIKIIISVGLV